jgi:chemotaxis protein MotB
MDTMIRLARVPVACTLIVLVAAGCGVSKAQYLDLTKNRDSIAAKNQELQAENEMLKGRISAMEAAVQDKQKSSDELKSTYDTLINNLKGELNSGKVEIQQLRDGISVNLAQDILFPSGSAKLDDSGRALLLKVSDDLKTSAFEVVVNGHTDNYKIGTALAARYPTNWELGAARSSQIVRLFEEAGIDKSRLSAVSYSDSRPRDTNNTAEGRARNRRIEIRLRPAAPSEPTAAQ